MICATTPKTEVAQGSANRLKIGAPLPPPPTGAGGGGSAALPMPIVVAQLATLDEVKKMWEFGCSEHSAIRLDQSSRLMKFDVEPCHSEHDPTSTDAFDISAMISAANKFSATTKPFAPLSSDELSKTSMHQIFIGSLWTENPSIFLKWKMRISNFRDVAKHLNSGVAA